MNRGQTTIDFAMGVGVFLLAITFIVMFVPGMMQPFTGGQERPLVADRAASHLVGSVLGDPASPSLLSETCTREFFNQANDSCETFDANEPITAQLGIPSQYSVNITVDESDPNDGPFALDGDALAAGSSIPTDADSVVVARRGVVIDGRSAIVAVRVW